MESIKNTAQQINPKDDDTHEKMTGRRAKRKGRTEGTGKNKGRQPSLKIDHNQKAPVLAPRYDHHFGPLTVDTVSGLS